MTSNQTAMPELPELPHPLEIEWPQLNPHALGCGVEDRGIRDRYEAAEYGWQDGVDKAAECVPEDLYTAEQMRAYARAAIQALSQQSEPVAKYSALLAAAPASPAPIDMILHCPKCGLQHVDETEDAEVDHGHVHSAGWSNPPHRSHLCHGCGNIWRPADVATNGVAAIKTKGKNDSPASPAQEHIAWCRYVTKHEGPTRIVLCDSDDEGAFKVYREPPKASPAQAPAPVAQITDMLHLDCRHVYFAATELLAACHAADAKQELGEDVDGSLMDRVSQALGEMDAAERVMWGKEAAPVGDEREAFVKWANGETFNFKRAPDGGYYWSDLDSAWRAWQARVALSTPAPQVEAAPQRYLCTPKNGGKPFEIDRAPDSWELRECDITAIKPEAAQAPGKREADVRIAALEEAATVIELYDDATMRNDYMLDSSECAEIIRTLKDRPTAPQLSHQQDQAQAGELNEFQRCQHPDCGRFQDRAGWGCRAMRDNACARKDYAARASQEGA